MVGGYVNIDSWHDDDDDDDDGVGLNKGKGRKNYENLTSFINQNIIYI